MPMWKREEAQPTNYKGQRFRSLSEAKVAKDLDALGVQWIYEKPVEGVNWYLPDFTITKAPQALALPSWIEVKPADALYALRDHLNLDERFEGEHSANLSAREIHDIPIGEIWKPKRLAEKTGQLVLIVSAINRTSTLSVTAGPETVVLSRCHPTVNYRKVARDAARRERERQTAAYLQEQQALREEQEANRRALHRRWSREAITWAANHGRQAKYPGRCRVCHQWREDASELLMYHAGEAGWVILCVAHVNETPATDDLDESLIELAVAEGVVGEVTNSADLLAVTAIIQQASECGHHWEEQTGQGGDEVISCAHCPATPLFAIKTQGSVFPPCGRHEIDSEDLIPLMHYCINFSWIGDLFTTCDTEMPGWSE